MSQAVFCGRRHCQLPDLLTSFKPHLSGPIYSEAFKKAFQDFFQQNTPPPEVDRGSAALRSSKLGGETSACIFLCGWKHVVPFVLPCLQHSCLGGILHLLYLSTSDQFSEAEIWEKVIKHNLSPPLP